MKLDNVNKKLLFITSWMPTSTGPAMLGSITGKERLRDIPARYSQEVYPLSDLMLFQLDPIHTVLRMYLTTRHHESSPQHRNSYSASLAPRRRFSLLSATIIPISTGTTVSTDRIPDFLSEVKSFWRNSSYQEILKKDT
jgi:hypothetical protein